MDTKEKNRKRTVKRRPAAAGTRKTAPSPDVVYTQPKPFSRNRFLLRLLTVVAVVLALTFGMSIFFKVKTVTVTGAEKYTAWEIREASGIQEGENLLTLSDAMISGKITAKLPYVKKVRVGIKLPDTVNIEIEELDVVYAAEGDDGTWWLMNAQGGIVEQTNASVADEHTKIVGVKLAAPKVGQQAVAAEPVAETTPEGETVPVTTYARERLSTVISILQYLEENGVVGAIASVDVTDMGALEIWYGQRYQVTLGDTTQLGHKIKSMKLAIDQMHEYQTGVLDVSFTTWPDEVGYTPFE